MEKGQRGGMQAAISFKDLCVFRTNQLVGKVLHVRMGGKPRVFLLPDATGLVVPPQC
jgi:hypothetical protein